jgi:hypothetical protein
MDGLVKVMVRSVEKRVGHPVSFGREAQFASAQNNVNVSRRHGVGEQPSMRVEGMQSVLWSRVKFPGAWLLN